MKFDLIDKTINILDIDFQGSCGTFFSDDGKFLQSLINRANLYVKAFPIRMVIAQPTYIIRCSKSCTSTYNVFESNLCNTNRPSMKIIMYGLGFSPDDDKDSVMNKNTDDFSALDIQSIQKYYSRSTPSIPSFFTNFTIPTASPPQITFENSNSNPVNSPFFWIIVIFIIIFWSIMALFLYRIYQKYLSSKKKRSISLEIQENKI